MLTECCVTFPIAAFTKDTWVTDGLGALVVSLMIRVAAIIMALGAMMAYLWINDIIYSNEESVMEKSKYNYKVVKVNSVNSDEDLMGLFETEMQAQSAKPKIYDEHKRWVGNVRNLIVKPVDPERICRPVCTDFMHYVFSLIPADDWKRVMKSDASAEIFASSLMCGGATYYYLSKMIPKDWTVIDIGCAYNPQSYLFQDHARHIAIEPVWNDSDFKFEYFQAPNTELLFMNGQDFILKELPKMDLDKNKTFCILNFVPSDEVNVLVRQAFKNLYVFYPA